ncbi:MAG: hypothetical protein ACREMN_13520 [Gemmatimonadales bacterium]
MGGLTRVRWALAAAMVCSLLACRERAQAVQSEAALREMVRGMMPIVAEASRLSFRREPVVLRRSRDQVRDYVTHKFDQELPAAELEGVQAALRLFGLVPDTLELRPTLIDLLTEQIAGFYEPDSGALYVAGDVEGFRARIVISHELVHALQDQYIALDSILLQKQRNDRRSAAHAVLEGQATLVQIPAMMPEQKPETLPPGFFWSTRSAMAQQQAQMEEFARAPLWLRETLIFPYLAGADFVVWMYRHEPDRPLLESMPASTEQILHPDRFAAGDAPTQLAFATPPPDTVLWEDGLGEFETRLLLQQHLGDEGEAARLATGWDGDRYQVLGREAGALVWYSVWDDAVAADRFARGLKGAWARRTAGRPDARTPRSSEISRLEIDGRPFVRLVDALSDWSGWRQLPTVRIQP